MKMPADFVLGSRQILNVPPRVRLRLCLRLRPSWKTFLSIRDDGGMNSVNTLSLLNDLRLCVGCGLVG